MVAIATTLLILPLSEVEVTPGDDVVQALGVNQSAPVALALSFVVIANYWTTHHALLRGLVRHTSRLIELNTVWLATIVFLPFPTALIEGGVGKGFGTLYLLSLLAASIATLLLAVYLGRHPDLFDLDGAADMRMQIARSWGVVGAIAIATVASIFNPAAGMWALFLLIPVPPLAARAMRTMSKTPTEIS